MNTFSKLAVASLTATIAAYIPAASAQSPSARAQAIVASFNKSKHAVKERHGVRVEKFREIRTELAPPTHPRDYSGSYEVEGLGSSLDLQIDDRGSVSGSGYDAINTDASIMRKFTIRNGRLDGALLTATKVYANGGTTSLEGVFINSTARNSPTDKRETTFGLGVIGAPVQFHGLTIEKFFFQRKH